MMRDAEHLSQGLCMLGVETARYFIILGLPRGHYQWCYYDLENGIAAKEVTSLEVVANMPLQSSYQGVRTF